MDKDRLLVILKARGDVLEVRELAMALEEAWRERDSALDSFADRTADWNTSLLHADELQARADRAEASLNQLREAAEAIDWDDIICTLESYDLEMGADSIPNKDVTMIKTLQRAVDVCKDAAQDPAR